MMLVHVTNDQQDKQFEHAGVLEIGRAPQRDVPRFQVSDDYVSRDHLRLEELAGGRVLLLNISATRPVVLATGENLPPGGNRTLELPVSLTLGLTRIAIDPVRTQVPCGAAATAIAPTADAAPAQRTLLIDAEEDPQPFNQAAFQALAETPSSRIVKGKRPPGPAGPAAGSVTDTLARWLETVLVLQQAAPGSAEFYRQTAQAVVELIDLDLGLVLLRRADRWTIAGAFTANDTTSIHYSRTLLDHVATTRATVYQDISAWQDGAASLRNIEAVVAAPILGVGEEVGGVLYGARVKGAMLRGGVQTLEAQLVQLLAATVASHLARSAAERTRMQFEQFFSPELVRELERNPDVLEGRNQEVTVLFGDLRAFTALSQRLGPQDTCRLIRDMMDRLSERIVEHGGVIVDYSGDGILAMWNAPTPQADHAARACHAAAAMLGELPGLNAQWRELAGVALSLGIGINTGPAQVGNTGSSRRFQYGPLGHTVNLASRVQGATKALGLPVLITAATRQLLPPGLAIRRLGRVRVPGVQEPVVLHELHPDPAPAGWEAWRDTYERALTEYEGGQWARACQTLLPLLHSFEKEDHRDPPTLKLMRRIGECLETRPDPFDPILEVGTK